MCQDILDVMIHFMYIHTMATEKPRVLLTLDDDLLERIDDFRYNGRIPSRSEAVRRLIVKGLEAFENAPSTPPALSKKESSR